MAKLSDVYGITKTKAAKVVKPRALAVGAAKAVKAGHRARDVSRETGRPEAMVARTATEKRRDAEDAQREPAAPVITDDLVRAAQARAVAKLAASPVTPGQPPEVEVAEGPGYGKPFLLQVTVRQEERLEEERRILGFRSRSETIRHYLERALKQAEKGRLTE